MLVSINTRSQVQTHIGILSSLVGCIARAMGVMRSSFLSGKLIVSMRARLCGKRERSLANISRSGGRLQHCFLELLSFSHLAGHVHVDS